MNKPIRCTTHFHACDCREYEFEMMKKENERLRRELRSSSESFNTLSATDAQLIEELKKENEELISLILKIRDTIKKNHPEYFDDWVGEFVHSPAVCLERVYLLLKEGV